MAAFREIQSKDLAALNALIQNRNIPAIAPATEKSGAGSTLWPACRRQLDAFRETCMEVLLSARPPVFGAKKCTPFRQDSSCRRHLPHATFRP